MRNRPRPVYGVLEHEADEEIGVAIACRLTDGNPMGNTSPVEPEQS